MTATGTLACLTVVAVVATLAVARVASFPEQKTTITTACDEANVTKPEIRQIDKLINDYTRHRAGVAAALSGCR